MPDERPGDAAPSTIGGIATSRLIEAALALGLVGLLLWGVLMVLAPFVMAILFGAFIAVGTWPLRNALVTRGVEDQTGGVPDGPPDRHRRLARRAVPAAAL